MRLSKVEFAALFDGLDWSRVQAVKGIPTPTAERDALAARNDHLRYLLLRPRRLQFRRKSECLSEAQIPLGLEALEVAIA